MLNENIHWTNIAKKIFYVVIAIALIIGSLKLLVFYMPFLIAFVISLMIEPAIKKLMERFRTIT